VALLPIRRGAGQLGDTSRERTFTEVWTNHESGEEVESCTILTTGANEMMKPIHDRMPVILPSDAYDAWLDKADATVLKPYDAKEMEAYPISTYVNSPRNQGPKCLEAIAS
jgi:putative SOS response-associated peptidase YedK